MVESTKPGKMQLSDEKIKLRDELKQYSERMLANAEALTDDWKLKFEDKEREYKVYVKKTSEGPCVVTKFRMDGVTLK